MTAPGNLFDLRARAQSARVSALPAPLRGVARRALLAWIDTAASHGMTVREALRRLRDGEAAIEAGQAMLGGQLAAPDGPAATAACAEGCAFCCILSGPDGGTVTGSEAVRLHKALSPLAGRPDGRDWHPKACPALDPRTRTCRAYEARPMICRAYLSPDAALCARVAEGEQVAGPGVLGAYPVYLAVLALTRETLKGSVAVHTYALARAASAALAGDDNPLESARHAPRELTLEIDRQRAALRR